MKKRFSGVLLSFIAMIVFFVLFNRIAEAMHAPLAG